MIRERTEFVVSIFCVVLRISLTCNNNFAFVVSSIVSGDFFAVAVELVYLCARNRFAAACVNYRYAHTFVGKREKQSTHVADFKDAVLIVCLFLHHLDQIKSRLCRSGINEAVFEMIVFLVGSNALGIHHDFVLGVEL